MYAPICASYAAGLVVLGLGLTIARAGSRPRWAADIGRQLAGRMRSGLPMDRSGAIEQAHYIATHHPDVDLRPAVPALIEVYRSDLVPRYRLAAVATLHAIGDEAGMRAVGTHLTEQSDRYVQIVSIAALRDHYGKNSYFDSDDVASMSQAILEGLNPPSDPPANT